VPSKIIHTYDITEFYGNVWEKQTFEGARAFSAFKTYRDMPAHTRSVKNALIEMYGRAQESRIRTWYGWSSKYRWVWRATEWDKEKDRLEQIEHVKAIKEMRSRHVRVGQALFSLGVEGVKILQEQIKTKSTELTPELMLKLISAGVQLERDGLGAPEEIESLIMEEVESVTDLSSVTTLSLRRLIAERRRLMPAGTTPNLSDDEDQL
jgi:hypothetical protein